ncbi:MAG TPA: aromatic amino acid lyase, partial [Acidimicrobiales bacterium]|nr:aromatic amino acid lyase [Acidimicrobiales bacterium]
MAVTVDSRADFTLEALRRVTVDGEGVVVGDAAHRTMARARAGFEELLDSDPEASVYGVTTRPGVEVATPVPPDERASYARSFRGTPRGFGRCHLDDRVVRGIVFARLCDFVAGAAKVRPVLAERVASLLGHPMPAVPLDGQEGAGEILPMMHVMAGVPADDLVEGEGMALVNGSPCSAALVGDTALHARNRLELAESVFALAIEGLRAPLEAYDEALASLWGDDDEAAALRALGQHLEGADPGGRLAHQAPVSYRILPRVVGQAHHQVGTVERVAGTSLASVTGNPVYLAPDGDHPLGRVLSAGGYHNAAATSALSALCAVWADLALLAHRQVLAMHAEGSGLPHLLAPPGFRAGASGGATNLFGWVATGLVEEARAAAAPTLLPATGNDPQNDVASPTFAAYRKERRAAECLDGVLAILALTSSQALFVTGRRPAPPLTRFLAWVRGVFPPVESQRADQDLEVARLADLLGRGALT